MSRKPAVGAITAVICHYNPTDNPFLHQLVKLCVASLQKIPDEHLTILVCDGSPENNLDLAGNFTGERIRYLHDGRQLSFGATYNLGIEAASTPYVALIANDILISSHQLRKLANELTADIACTVPYLVRSDYATQIYRRTPVPRLSFPAMMTLNVNVFDRVQLNAIGNVPEDLSGAYNDAVMFHRLRQQGKRIGLIYVGDVDHMRAATRKTASNMAYEQDLKRASELAPEMYQGINIGKQKNIWARVYANNAQYPLAGLLWRLVAAVPWKLNQQRGLAYRAGMVEPYLSCKPAAYGQAFLNMLPFGRSRGQ